MNVEEDRVRKCLQAFKAVINIDTVLIRCGRCDGYLGDAQLSGEGCEPNCVAHNSSNGMSNIITPDYSNTANTETSMDSPFSLSDLRDVRFSPSAVVLRAHTSDTFPIEMKMSSEQVVVINAA